MLDYGQIVTEPSATVLSAKTNKWSSWSGRRIFVTLNQDSFWVTGYGKIEKDGHLRRLLAKAKSLDHNQIIIFTIDLSENQVYARYYMAEAITGLAPG